MPLYEYECQKCRARLEVMQKFTDKPLTRCPECKGRLEKLLSAPAIQFKGSGWYVTDYAGKKSDGGEEKRTASSESSTTESSTTETKSASKEISSAKKGAHAKSSKKTKGGD